MEQKIALDTCVFIYIWNEQPEFFESCKNLLDKICGGSAVGIFATLGMIEVLTGPKKLGQRGLAFFYRDKLLNFPNLQIVDLNINIAEIASDLRAKYNLRTPDAVHLATALWSNAEKFVTNDKALLKVKEIKIEVLK